MGFKIFYIRKSFYGLEIRKLVQIESPCAVPHGSLLTRTSHGEQLGIVLYYTLHASLLALLGWFTYST